MKKIVLFGLTFLGLININTTQAEILTPEFVFTQELNFKVEMQDNKVITQWTKYSPPGFSMYKILRTTRDSDPYPNETNFIKKENTPEITTFIDHQPLPEETYYRVCAITETTAFCSNVLKVSPVKVQDVTQIVIDKHPLWRDRCIEWNGTIEEPNICRWKEGLWVDTTGLYSGVAEELFEKYGDPRIKEKNIPDEVALKWRTQCTEWKGEIEEPNICRWTGDRWVYDKELFDGTALEIFEKYGDPRIPKETENNKKEEGEKEVIKNIELTDDITDTTYETAIIYLKNKKIVKGYDDGSFKPTQKINRAEFTKIIIEAAFPNQATGENCFSDITNEWFAPYVCFAKEKGIVNGYENNTFNPSQNINFAEASKILVTTLI